MRLAGMMMGGLVLLLAGGAQAQTQTQAQAQETSNSSVVEKLRSTAPVQAAPRLTADEIKQLNATAAAAPAVVQARGRSVAYMLAGAALFVGGALIGGDAGTLLMIGGVGFGAYGIYLHFR
jgi:hypothetical protein